MKKFLLSLFIIFACCQCTLAKQETLYVAKDINPSHVISELQKNLSNSIVNTQNNILYTNNNDTFYYFQAYSYENGSEIFSYTNNGDTQKIMSNLPFKVFPLNDKSTLNKYNKNFIEFASQNKIGNIKTKKQEDNNSKYNKYNPYSKNLKNTVIETVEITQNNISIERKKLIPKVKVKRYMYAYEYTVKNNTGKDITINNVASADFIGLTQIAALCTIPGKDYIPLYGIVYAVQTDLEKNKFTRPHPQDEIIKAGDTMRILALAKKDVTPSADFIFTIDDKKTKITMK